MINLTLPLSKESIEPLRIYDRVLLSGTLLVGRDQVHKRLVSLIEQENLGDINLENETMFYMGPSQKPVHLAIGSAGPTTSARMDPFTPQLLQAGLLATIGKGPRSKEVIKAIQKREGLYFVAFGGCGALYATTVVDYSILAFEDLGPEALLRLTVKDFPAIVGVDSLGNSLF
ncbi:MAG: FumA C-terminus/TtdB family hydratase beta subunit [Sphaerochaetaceae bacterium]